MLKCGFNRRCYPGGFTKAILKHNPKARGHGIALPEEEGGSSPLVSDQHKTRITVHLHDVTHFDLSGPFRTDPIPALYIPLPFRTKFNLVTLDAHRFGTPREGLEEGETTRMILSQLLIALESTAINGIILMRLSLGQGDQMVAILYMFSLLFRTLSVHKPVCGHKGRGSFYAVADGFQGTSFENARVLEKILVVLRKQWWDASFSGEEGRGRWIDEWWDEIVKSEELPKLFGMRFIELITPVWETQIIGLKTHFRKNKVAF